MIFVSQGLRKRKFIRNFAGKIRVAAYFVCTRMIIVFNRKYKAMKKKELTIDLLIKEAKAFCDQENGVYRAELFAVTDGKKVGTIVEHLFQSFLEKRYSMTVGSSAMGLDLPSVNTDIKVTSIAQPQSSCPYKDSKQKIYGLGYNLIVFVYQKVDDNKQKKGKLDFLSCTFIESQRTADYQTTTGLKKIIDNDANVDDVFAFLVERNIPGDEVTLLNMARDILNNPPQIGYLTISNALQWRLQYGRIVNLDKNVAGIIPIVKYDGK